MSEPTRLPEVFCCCGEPYTAHGATPGPRIACSLFTPRPAGYDEERFPMRCCDHGYAHWSCGDCCPGGAVRR